MVKVIENLNKNSNDEESTMIELIKLIQNSNLSEIIEYGVEDLNKYRDFLKSNGKDSIDEFGKLIDALSVLLLREYLKNKTYNFINNKTGK